jgi:hypothetical protein
MLDQYRYFRSKLLLNCLALLSSTKGGRLLDMCWKVFRSLLFTSLSRLLSSFSVSLIFIFSSITLASPANLGFPLVSELVCWFSSLIMSLGARGLRLVSRKDSEWLMLMLASDTFLSLLNLLVKRRHELFVLSIVLSSICIFCGLI